MLRLPLRSRLAPGSEREAPRAGMGLALESAPRGSREHFRVKTATRYRPTATQGLAWAVAVTA
jgi:hypothetical protein